MAIQTDLTRELSDDILKMLSQPWKNSSEALEATIALKNHPPSIILQLYAQGTPEVETKCRLHVKSCDRCAERVDYLRDMAKRELVN